MEISTLKDRLLDFFSEIDHTLLSDPKNDPFVQVTIISMSAINPHRDSFGLYLAKKGLPAEHTEFSTTTMGLASALEAAYLAQKPSKAKLIEEPFGTTHGMVAGKNQVAIITIIAHHDDAGFICQSIMNKIKIILNQ